MEKKIKKLWTVPPSTSRKWNVKGSCWGWWLIPEVKGNGKCYGSRQSYSCLVSKQITRHLEIIWWQKKFPYWVKQVTRYSCRTFKWGHGDQLRRHQTMSAYIEWHQTYGPQQISPDKVYKTSYQRQPTVYWKILQDLTNGKTACLKQFLSSC